MKKIIILTMLILSVLAFTVSASETTVKGRLYAHWMMDMTDGAESANEFGLSRTYIKLKSKLSERTSVNITADLRNINGYDGYGVIIKYGFFDWKPSFGNDKVSFRFGLQPTFYISYINKYWGHRYVSKTASDLAHFLPPSDLGFSMSYYLSDGNNPCKIGIAFLNGTSYTDVEELNKNKDINIFAHIKPLRNNEDFAKSSLFGQFYMGTQNEVIADPEEASDWKNQIFSVAGNLVYRKTFNFGTDFNFRTLGQGAGTDDLKERTMSFFGTLYFEELVANSPGLRTLSLFGRFDITDPDTDTEDDGNSLLIFGLECSPVKGFKAAINYRNLSYQEDGKDSESFLYLNTVVDF